MRILVSAVVHHEELCDSFASEAGAEVVALAPAYIDLGEYGLEEPDTAKERGHRLVALPVVPTRPYPYSMYRGGVARLLRDFRPDILLCIGEPSELGVAQVVRLARRICPDTRVVLISLENVQRNWAGFPKMLRGRAETVTLSRTDMVAATSQSAKRLLVSQNVPEERLCVIYPGFDTTPFAPHDASGLRETLGWTDRFVVGFVGRLVPEKGVDLLLRALTRLPDDAIAAVAGDGWLEPALREEAEQLGVADRVSWLGRLDRSQIVEHVCAFDALALPSRGIPVWQEQFGRVLAEAMLCGTPVIGSDSGAIPEVIGDAGLVFAEDDCEALVARIARLRDDPNLRARLSEAGIRRAQAEFSHEKRVASLLELFADARKLPARV